MGPQFNEGEIAITTNTKFRENRSKVVRLKEYLGRRHWPECNTPEHVWLVECLCGDSYLYYLYPRERDLTRTYVGQMPERFMKRISTESGQGVLDLHEIPVEVGDSDASV
jgi:hypothetical protein